VVLGWSLNLPWAWGSYGRLGEELEGHFCMINVFWVRRRRYVAGMYWDNLRDTAAQEGPVLCIIYHYHLIVWELIDATLFTYVLEALNTQNN
jgi:hypothetical protein